MAACSVRAAASISGFNGERHVSRSNHADNGLQFALRDQNFAGRNDHAASPWHARVIVPDGSVGAIDTLPDHGRVYRSGGIDIRV